MAHNIPQTWLPEVLFSIRACKQIVNQLMANERLSQMSRQRRATGDLGSHAAGQSTSRVELLHMKNAFFGLPELRRHESFRK